MILCLSSSFLRRVRIQWNPDLCGFLIGDRNLHFFYPDSVIEVPEISAASIDAFLAEHNREGLQLLGFIAPAEVSLIPGYVELQHGGEKQPEKWNAVLNSVGDHGEERLRLEIKISTE